jgi:hypothetical protein
MGEHDGGDKHLFSYPGRVIAWVGLFEDPEMPPGERIDEALADGWADAIERDRGARQPGGPVAGEGPASNRGSRLTIAPFDDPERLFPAAIQGNAVAKRWFPVRI